MTARDVAVFSKRMNDIDHSKRRTEVFRDFCEMAYLALANTTAQPAKSDATEAEYMACVRRYRHKDDVRKMRDLLEIAVAAIAPGSRDFLGEVAAELGALDASLGQFFTPYDVSRLIAEMNLSDAKSIIEDRGFITLQEPAAGAGGMVIAAADALEKQGFDPRCCLWFEATEINRSTFHMLHIQTAYRGLAGRNIHGNSLTVEKYDSTLTPNALHFLAQRAAQHRRDSVQKSTGTMATAGIERRTQLPASDRQLSLFG
ncbi:N-6 DNA methylase [Phaeovulum sp. W22_SRMD_FR3]|uniref:N-6 DNA methylase n=1 Tax=Phaeovulum sp. W22_SRMD_FR3 TaxID=3240274 RepID=UPI003F9477CC